MSSAENERTILIISYDFPPRAVRSGTRAAHLAVSLARNGWRTIVVACSPDNFVNRDDVWLQSLADQGVEVHLTAALRRSDAPAGARVATPSPLIRRWSTWLRQWRLQPDETAAWRRPALPVIEQILANNTVNMILAAAPPFSDFTLAQEVAEKHSIPFALDYGETWFESPLHITPTPMHRTSSLKLEEAALRKAGLIFTTTRRTKEDLLRRFRYLTHEDILIVPHGFDEREWSGPEDERVRDYCADLPAVPKGACLITAYQDFHEDNTIRLMLKAIRQMCAKKPELRSQLRVRIIGLVRPKHRHLVRKWKLGDVVDIRTMAHRPEACALVARTDIAWYVSRHDRDAGSAIIGDYCGAQKPVLLNCPAGPFVSATQELLPCVHAQAQSAKQIRQGIEAALEAWFAGTLAVNASAKRDACSYTVSTKEMSRLLGIGMKM